MCKVNARLGVTTALAVDQIARMRCLAVAAWNAVQPAERFVCRRMRLCAVFERANPFACVKYCSASHFDPIPIQEQRMWPDMCDGCMKRVPTSRALRVSKIVFVRSHRACSSMYRFDFVGPLIFGSTVVSPALCPSMCSLRHVSWCHVPAWFLCGDTKMLISR